MVLLVFHVSFVLIFRSFNITCWQSSRRMILIFFWLQTIIIHIRIWNLAIRAIVGMRGNRAAVWFIRVSQTHIIHFVHLLIRTSRCIPFFHIDQIPVIQSFLMISTPLSNTRWKHANLLYHFNLCFPIIFPILNIIGRLPILQPLQHSFVFNKDTVHLAVSKAPIKTKISC